MEDLADTILCIRGAALSTLKLVLAKGDLPAVFETIQTCPNLHTLAVATYGNNDRVFVNAASLPYPRHPTLRRLDVSDSTGGYGLYDFIHHFFPNLEELSFSIHASGVSEIANPPDLVRFNLPRLQQLEVKGSLAFSAPLIRHISPLAFPALHACTWVLPYVYQPSQREAAFVAEVIDSIGHLRDRQVGRAVPFKAAIDFGLEYNRTLLQPGLEALGATKIGVKRGAGGGGGGGVVFGLAAQSPVTSTRPANPPGLILTPKMYRTEEDPDKDKVEDLGNIISTSLDRIRDLKDAAVAVGDRFQISRIAEALQEGEWLCMERQC